MVDSNKKEPNLHVLNKSNSLKILILKAEPSTPIVERRTVRSAAESFFFFKNLNVPNSFNNQVIVKSFSSHKLGFSIDSPFPVL